jgi:nucleoside-diphosphate-sugar epimerase
MAEILLTGATGLLGSAVMDQLVRRHGVTVLARRPPPQRTDARWVVHDLSRPTLPPELPSRVDAVIHLAQGRAFRHFPERAQDTFAVNVASTELLLDWAVGAGASRFVLASTGAVYDRHSAPHHEEEPTPLPGIPSFYAASKLAAETLARAYGSCMVVCVLRPFFVYGARQDRAMLLPRLVASIRAGETIWLDGHDGMRFNPIHVSDAAKAVVASLDVQASCVVNVAGPQVLSLRQAVDLLADALGVRATVQTHPAPVGDLIADIARMRALLVPPETVLADVAAELCASAAKNGE